MFYELLGMAFDGVTSFTSSLACFRMLYHEAMTSQERETAISDAGVAASENMDYNSRRKSVALLFAFNRKPQAAAHADRDRLGCSDFGGDDGEHAAQSQVHAPGENEGLTLNPRRPRDYIAIYIHFLHRVVKRLVSKGFKVLFQPHTYKEISYAVLLDPNGIEVRLYELTDEQYYFSKSKPAKNWYGRLGFYVMHVEDAAKASEDVEKLFSCQISNPFYVSAEFSERYYLAKNATFRHLQRHSSVREGLQIVDTEHLLSGIHMFHYFWVSHAPRDSAPSLCFVDYHDSITQSQPMNKNMRLTHVDSALLSVGIELAIPMAAAFKQLRACGAVYGIGIDVYPQTEQFVNGVGVMTTLRDLHGVNFDLCCSNEVNDFSGKKLLVNAYSKGFGAGKKPSTRKENGRSFDPKEKKLLVRWVSVDFYEDVTLAEGAVAYPSTIRKRGVEQSRRSASV